MSKYQAWGEDDDRSEAVTFVVDDAYDAAAQWAERSDWNSGEYSIANGREATVFVALEGSDDNETFTVIGEAMPHYIAHKAL